MQFNIPQDLELEALCLSCLMNSINAANEGNAFLEVEDFFDPDHRELLVACKKIISSGKECDLTAMFYEFKEPQGKIDRNFLLTIYSLSWSGIPYLELFQKLKNLSSLRKAISAGKELISESSKDNADFEQVIGDHQNRLVFAMGNSNETHLPKKILQDFREGKDYFEYCLWRKERFTQGLPSWNGVVSGYPLLDNTLGGFQNGALYYIGARTSMGKTTFILNLINKMLPKYSVGMFSLEMPASTIFEKLMLNKAELKYSKFSSGNFTAQEYDRLLSLKEFYQHSRFYIEDESGLSISKLCARAKRLKTNHKIDILFIDYLTLVKGNQHFTNKHLMVDDVSKGLQALAKSLNIPIVCLAQLNRSAAESGRPTLSHFRESGSIEEDADACLLLHRPEYYQPTEKPGLVEVIVAKNRIMGTIKTIHFSCDAKVSDKYHECEEIQTAIKKAEAFKEFDAIFPQ